jgi:energy-converting hydrogenase Eha subunit F
VTVYALGRELGAPRPASALFAAALTTVPAVLAPVLVKTQTDTVMLFGFAAGVLFLLRHRRSRAAADLLIAGTALGIAFGTKWYGVSCVAVVLIVWAVASYLRGDGWQVVGRRALVLVGIVLLAGGFWLLRNLIESGDPFFPARVRLLHVTVFDAPPDVVRQNGGFTIAHYFGNIHVLRVYVLPALLRTLGWLGALFGLSTVAAAALALVSRRRTSAPPWAGMVLAVAGAAILVALAYTVTPYTAFGARNMPVQTGDNTRYLVPALVLAAPLAAWLTGRLGRAGLLLELTGVGLMVDALSRLFPLGGGLALILTVAIGSAGMVALRPRFRQSFARLRPRRAMPSAIGLLVALTAVVGALVTRRAYNEQPYQADATLAWLLQHAPAGHRVGLAGVWSNGISPIFPAFGPRLGNQVAYVGPFVRHMLQQYEGAAPFVSAVRSGGYDLLIVGRGDPQPQPDVPSQAWARAAGFREVTESGRLVLYARAGA